MYNISRYVQSAFRKPTGIFQILSGLVLGLLLATAMSAQSRPNVVFWSDKPACGSKKITVGAQDQFSCKTESHGKRAVRVIETAGLKISILPGRTAQFVALLTRIDNKRSEELVLDFSKWSVAHYVSRNEFLAGKPPIVNEESIDAGAPTKNGTVRATPSLSADPFPMAETRTVESRSSPASPNIVTQTTPQTVIAPTTGNVGVSNFPAVTLRRVRTGVAGFKTTPLRVNVVSPMGNVNGIVYFGRVKESGYQLAFVHIGDTTFVFEIE